MERLKRVLILLFLLFFMAALTSVASAATVAYWRFDGDGSAGGALPSIGGYMGWNSGNWQKAVHDWSGNGNHLTTFYYPSGGFNWSSTVPEAVVPFSGASNTLSIVNAGASPDAFTWSTYSNPSGTNIGDTGDWTPEQWTIEASFYVEDWGGAHQTIVGRDGQLLSWDPGMGHLNNVGAFYLSVRPNLILGTEFTDMNGVNHVIESSINTIAEGQWYHAVVVSDGETMSLYYADVELDTGFQLVGQLDMTASSTDTRLAHGDVNSTSSYWNSGNFSVGRAVYSGNKVDFFDGFIDEIRISDTALKPSHFLFQKRATEPNPADESVTSTSVVLSWDPILSATGHDVYFDDNFDDVNDANRDNSGDVLLYVQNYDSNSYPVSSLTPGITYYWRIDEVNGLDVGPKGTVWSFTVTPLKASNPSPYIDEICVLLDAQLSWTAGVSAASHDVYFGTTNPPPFVQNQPGTTYNPPGDMLQNTDYWWKITEVNGLDEWEGDIWHFKTIIDPIPSPDPNLVGWWIFDEGRNKAIDWSGEDNHGTVYGGAEPVEGYDGDGLNFDGTDDYVELPIGDIIATLDSATIATWVNFTDTGGLWQRIFDFGNSSTTGYMFLTPRVGADGVMRFAITETDWQNDAESQVDAFETLATGWHHVAVAIDGDMGWVTLYLDGAFLNDGSTDTLPSDLGVTVQNWLGRSQYSGDAYFSGILDDFRIYKVALTEEDLKTVMASKAASLPDPTDNETHVNRNPILSWQPGIYAADTNGHELYYGTDFNDVNDRVGDPIILDDPCYVIPGPNAPYDSLEVIYWVVDEVNDSHPSLIWPGNVWQFTIRDYSLIDDFELYTSTGKSEPPPEDTLKSVWVDGNYAWVYATQTPGTSGSLVQLNTDSYDGAPGYVHYTPDDDDIAQSGAQSMKFYYDNDGTVTWEVDIYEGHPPDLYTYTPTPDQYLSEAYAAVDDAAADPELDSLDMLRDFSVYKVLGLPYYGDPNNDSEPMYVSLEDSDGTVVTISNSSLDLTKPWWQDWYIKLSDFTDKNAGLALTDIVKIYIGFGDKESPSAGGSGVVFFDDIRLYAEGVCISDEVPCDLDGDCKVDNNDLRILVNAEPWYGEKPVSLPEDSLIINLNASTIGGSDGDPVTSWTNNVTDGGTFDVNSSISDGNTPVLDTIESKKCVTFEDINDLLIWTKVAPGGITGANDFTVILEVFNPSIKAEEWVIGWSERSTPDGSFSAFGYGTHETWGAAAHYGAAYDMGFGPPGAPEHGEWHTIAFTYDGTTESVIVDGLVYDTEAKDLIVEPNQPVVIGTAYGPATDGSIAGYWDPIWANPDLRFTGSVASIKVYDDPIPAVELALWMGSEADMRIDNKIDFKDIAVLAGDCWLTGPFLFGD